MSTERPTRAASLVGGIVLLAILYFAAGRPSLLMAIAPGYATAFGPAAGIALAALVFYGRRLWPGVALGSFLVNLTAGPGPLFSPVGAEAVAVAGAMAIGAAAQALLGAVLVQRFLERDPGLLEMRNVVAALVLGAPVSCLVSSSWSTGVLLAAGLIGARELGFHWTTWWVGDSLGVLLLLPLALAWLGKPSALWARRRLAVAVPLLLIFGFTVAGFLMVGRLERAELKASVTRSGEIAGDALEKQIVRYLEVMYSIQSYMASTEEFTRDEFRRYVGRSLERVPGIQALSWNPRVIAAQRAAHEAATQREGLPAYRITERNAEGKIVTAAPRPEYVVVHYIEPYAKNRDALGYDVYSQPIRRVALDLARDNGKAAGTAPITLVQETGKQMGMLVFVPIFRSGLVPEDLEQRRGELLGYATGVFRLGDVLTTTLAALGIRNLEAKLYDATQTGEAKPLAAYHWDGEGKGELIAFSEIASPAGALAFAKNYDMAGRSWRLVLAPDSNFLVANRPLSAWTALAAGMLFAGLLVLFVLALTGRWILEERQATELAKANTRLTDEVAQRVRTEQALQAEKDRAEVTLQSIGDAVITTDANGVVEYLNPVAESLTGWSTREARGQPLPEVFRILIEETREPAQNPLEHCREEGRSVSLAKPILMVSRSGGEYAIENSTAPIRDHDNQVQGFILVFHDVSETRRMTRETSYQATHDALTGLLNRREFDRRLEQATASSKLYGMRHALCFLDLDRFKVVNDTCGHQAGDELLRNVASLLARAVRERDTLARLGGDEFGLLLDNCPVGNAIEIAENLVGSVRDFRFVWDKQSFSIGVSVGLVPIDGQMQTADLLLSRADAACYTAKDLGRNRVHVYDPNTAGAEPRHREIVRRAELLSAIEENRFRFFGQPIFSLAAPAPRTLRQELLLRMLDENNRAVLPGIFMPQAERLGLMDQIDRWVVRTAFREYRNLFPDHNRPHISINLSGNLIGDDSLPAFLREQFAAHGIDPAIICFEITETAAIRNISAASHVIRTMRDAGGKFALDNYGSGLSSFSSLKALPVDYLKIDGSLMGGIAGNGNERAMVEAINLLAHRLGMQTVAEQVDTLECLQVLREMGIDHAQGFALGEPKPLPRAET